MLRLQLASKMTIQASFILCATRRDPAAATTSVSWCRRRTSFVSCHHSSNPSQGVVPHQRCPRCAPNSVTGHQERIMSSSLTSTLVSPLAALGVSTNVTKHHRHTPPQLLAKSRLTRQRGCSLTAPALPMQ
jgi:hypothetical protein